MSSDIVTGFSLTSSIVWDDCEEELDTGTWMLWDEGVVCVYNPSAVSAVKRNSFWAHLIIHIVFMNEDSVPDINLFIGYIQREGSSP